jgi:hypothetical protein
MLNLVLFDHHIDCNVFTDLKVSLKDVVEHPVMAASTPPTSFAASAENVADVETLSLHSETTPAPNESPSKKRTRRRPERSDTDGRRDQEETPRGLPNRRPILRPVSPKKALRSLSPSQFTCPKDLQRLEKPVFVVGEAGFQGLPSDIHELVDDIESIQKDRTPFIPGEVQAELTLINERRGYRKPKDVWFTPRPSQAGTDTNMSRSTQRVLEELGVVLDIRHETEMSSRWERHEAAWNSAVHHPLLRLAFCDGREAVDDVYGEETGTESQRAEQQDTRVRIENITAATIAGDCVPHIRDTTSSATSMPAGGHAQAGRLISSRVIEYDDHVSVLAWSLSMPSSSSSAGSAEDGSDLDPFTEAPRQVDGTTHSRSGSKKVDFALVLDPKPGTSLYNSVQMVLETLRQSPQQSQSINPCNYKPLLDAPIAVAVGTKTIKAVRDPLTQLGMIAAALHRRLHTLPVKCAAGFHALTDSGILPTWPLITVVDDTWMLYFACDRGRKIVSCSFLLPFCSILTNRVSGSTRSF